MKIKTLKKIPDIIEVAPDIYKIVIPQPFYTANNVYLINCEEPALIDSGYVANLGMLQAALGKIGLSLRKIRHIFYTHEHIDHISVALSIRYYSDARLYGMLGMQDSVGDYGNFIRTFQRAMDRMIYRAHHDSSERDKYLVSSRLSWTGFLSALKNSGKTDPILRMDVELVEGDVIQTGSKEIGFIHTPGHNRWHLTPYILGTGIFFTGDLVLENISSVYSELDGDITSYHKSLDRLMKMPIQRILPAHGDEPKNPQRAIKVLKKTLSLLERGIMRRLKEKDYDLKELVSSAIGPRTRDSNHYTTALAIIHAIISKHRKEGHIEIIEVDPPYERYRWKEKLL